MTLWSRLAAQWELKLLSVAFAVLLWIFVSSGDKLEAVFAVPLDLTDRPPGLEVTSLGVEVVVVDDFSDDGTADVVEELGLDNVRVVRVPPGGKATALNTGVALARHDLIVMVDADTVVEPDSLHRLVQPFGDETVGAVAGILIYFVAGPPLPGTLGGWLLLIVSALVQAVLSSVFAVLIARVYAQLAPETPSSVFA